MTDVRDYGRADINFNGKFCKQCALDNGWVEHWCNDFAGLAVDPRARTNHCVNKEEQERLSKASVICEGCGPTQVDHTGWCLATDCLEQHGKRED